MKIRNCVVQFSAKASVLNINISNIISPHLAVSNTLVWRLNVRIEHFSVKINVEIVKVVKISNCIMYLYVMYDYI
jgi:hypothetical protein